MGAVTIWPRSLPAPFFFIRPNFFPTLFLDSPRVADCSVPFDFSKRSKEERNWIIAGLFYQEIRKCFLNENIFSQGKKESQQSNQNNIILWVGNRVPCLLKFSKAKKKKIIVLMQTLQTAEKINLQAVIGFCVFLLKLLTAFFFLPVFPHLSPSHFIKPPE